MSRKLLWGIITVLLITNIATLLFMSQNDDVIVSEDGEEKAIRSNEPVATIDGEDVTYADWMTVLRENHGEKALQSLIDRHLVSKLAEEKNIEISEKVIERELAYLTSMQGPLEEEELARAEEKWREEVIYRYQLEFLLTEDVPIPEAEVEEYYNVYKNQYDFSPAMQLSHILVSDMETAERIYGELEQGANFEQLARENSIDDETKNSGGYLGFINTSSQFFPDGYEEIANEIGEHSYSTPFAAGNGVAIIYLHQALPEIEFSYEEIKPYVENELALHEKNISLQATPLWEEHEIDWLYGN
ncbi:peptidylprolyl isomerase [Oceanobacillus alkalisoli]|uniref:peptidylprolyl isomerase n=1 Tax=Oceanobacillus alkalisoli TaxID=2925113 RepID=UPI001EF1257B|nr:peptidylprolyl isomerase [Oceanobacillus alkalisoli]MCF3944450.1 peptidylprolyl isomerase [Oceanobacillus alkalisoli]MCG5105136.1 peptidylprolyl isomerase [Oceanobacillus alkalisoli]